MGSLNIDEELKKAWDKRTVYQAVGYADFESDIAVGGRSDFDGGLYGNSMAHLTDVEVSDHTALFSLSVGSTAEFSAPVAAKSSWAVAGPLVVTDGELFATGGAHFGDADFAGGLDAVSVSAEELSVSGSVSVPSGTEIQCDATSVSIAVARVARLLISDTQSYADNAAALAAGKEVGEIYHTAGALKCVVAAE